MMTRNLLPLCLAALVLPLSAQADRVGLPTDTPAAYKTECGSCHAPYPPGLLSGPDWKKTLTGLDRHFGTDASLDSKTTATLSVWLERHAGRRPAGKEAAPRITTSAWFKHEHDEVPAPVWQDTRVKSPANCTACHQGADQGRYGERELSIPGRGRWEEH